MNPWRRARSTIRSWAALLGLAGLAGTSTLTAIAGETPPHGIPAINLSVTQNDTGNSVDSVTLETKLTINDLRIRPGSNRGDYNLQVGDTGTDDVDAGLLLVAVSENGRDNGELENLLGYAAPSFDYGAAGYWAVVQDATVDRAEYNMNIAAAYFPFDRWIAGFARNANRSNGATNNFFVGSPGLVLGTHFRGISGGRSRVDLRTLGITSTNSGVLLVNHAKNEGNYANSAVNADGTWEIYIKDNFGSATNPRALEQDPAAFVYIPRTDTNVVSGRFGVDETGTNAVVLLHNGDAPRFTVTQLEPGRFRLDIAGGSPTAGVLITSMEGGLTNNFDNILSYQADGNGWILEHRDTGVYPPVLEACTNEPVAAFVYIPGATPGMSAAPARTAVTTEDGGTATVDIVLDVPPSSPVTLRVVSTRPEEATIAPEVLTFLPENWNVPQTLTVFGQDDAIADGAADFTIMLTVEAGSDESFLSAPELRIPGINSDDESAGITAFPVDGIRLTEAGSTATSAFQLSRPPVANVRIPLASLSPDEASVEPTELVFTPGNWNVAQTVTVRGVDDGFQDGTQAFSVRVGPAISDDPAFSGLAGRQIQGETADNDVARLVWNYSLPLTVVESQSITYSVALGTQPNLPVELAITSAIPASVTVSPATVTFTPEDWKNPKVITLSAPDNATNQPTLLLNITHTLRSVDPVYTNFVGETQLPAVIVDNETALELPSGTTFYGLGMPPVGIDGRATLTDPDASNFDGARLTISITSGGTSQDRLAIRSAATNGFPVVLDGTRLLHSGIEVGSAAGGTSPAPLEIRFVAAATASVIEDVLRSITFATGGSATGPRLLAVRFEDGLGASGTVTKTVRVGQVRQTQFQEGADFGYGLYTGAGDIALSQVGSLTPWPIGRTPSPAEGLLMDWPDGGVPNESQILLRFDDLVGTNSWQVPPGATVLLAELVVHVNNPGDGARLHRMLIPWDRDAATWDSVFEGIAPDDIEARAGYESQLGVEDGSGSTGLGFASIGVTPDVQAWVRGETNHGWVFLGWPLRTDGTGISPSEIEDIRQRPRLRVLWTDANARVASFQQGVDGYEGTRDTLLRHTQPETPLVTSDVLWADWPDGAGTNSMHSLIRFDDVFGGETGRIPLNARIEMALLDLPSVGTDNMGDGGAFHRMLQAWDDTTATWNSLENGIQANGVEAAIEASAIIGSPSLEPDVQGTVNTVEVTSDLIAWQAGMPNHGWALLPLPGGANGWGFRSSKFISFVDPLKAENERPRLRVFYSIPSGAEAALLDTPAFQGEGLRIGFTGSSGVTYRIVRSASVVGTYEAVGTATPDATGRGSFLDPNPPGEGAFYRVVAD